MKISIIIPAFNEEEYLPATLDAVEVASAHLLNREDVDVETDRRGQQQRGWHRRSRDQRVRRSLSEGFRGFRGLATRALHAGGDVLVFVDADVLIPESLLAEITSVMSDSKCVGGGVDVDYRPNRRTITLLLGHMACVGSLD